MATMMVAPPQQAEVVIQQPQQQQQRQQPERQANAIQVCLDRTPAFYSHLGRRMLHGSADDKPTFDEVTT